jgi:hypothetical protein
MRVGIFTDNDFGKINGVTTTLKAVLDHAPDDVTVRVYTASRAAVETPGYLALRAPAFGIPFYEGMDMCAPRFGAFLRAAQRDRSTWHGGSGCRWSAASIHCWPTTRRCSADRNGSAT